MHVCVSPPWHSHQILSLFPSRHLACSPHDPHDLGPSAPPLSPPQCPDQNDVGAVQVTGRRQRARGRPIDAGADLRRAERFLPAARPRGAGRIFVWLDLGKIELRGKDVLEYHIYIYKNTTQEGKGSVFIESLDL